MADPRSSRVFEVTYKPRISADMKIFNSVFPIGRARAWRRLITPRKDNEYSACLRRRPELPDSKGWESTVTTGREACNLVHQSTAKT